MMADADLTEIPDLPVPDVIEQLSFEEIVIYMRAVAAAIAPNVFSNLRESDPAAKLIEVFAWAELRARASFNDRSKAMLLPTADEDMLAYWGLLMGVPRKVIDAGPPPVYEDLDDWRLRIANASRTWSVAGPKSAYEALALEAHDEVVTAYVDSPNPGEVRVSITLVDGAPAGAEHITAVLDYLSADTRRPLTDNVSVVTPAFDTIDFVADVVFPDVSNVDGIVAKARANFVAYCESQLKAGGQLSTSGMIAALMVSPAIRVDISSLWTLHPDPADALKVPDVLNSGGTLVTATFGIDPPVNIYP